MNRPAIWIRKRAKKLWRCLKICTQRGNTIILVTHERDIATHARRTVHLRDGLIETDHAGFIPELDLVALDRP